jgi:tetratricopeptide (TPR) repeat protein
MRKKPGDCSLGSFLIAAVVATSARAASSESQSASVPPAIQRMIEQARQALADGNAATAAELFEKAAERGEYAEAEVGEVRARLWAGQFRHAVAISSVVAGEHPESAEAQALLGYVEDRYGYTSQALQRLRGEEQARPLESAPVAAEAEILIDRHSAAAAVEVIDRWVSANGAQEDLCRLRVRANLVENGDVSANHPANGLGGCAAGTNTLRRQHVRDSGSSIPEGQSRWPEPATAKFPVAFGVPTTAGNGLIIGDGRQVATLRRLVDPPRGSVQTGSRSSGVLPSGAVRAGAVGAGSGQPGAIWVRNARGELRQAKLEALEGGAASEIAILSLSAPFPLGQSIPLEASGKSDSRGLCFALGFPSAVSADAMLPAVTPCFAVGAQGANGRAHINIPLSASEVGTPVFDSNGRLMGLADPAEQTLADSGPVKIPRAMAGLVALSPAGDLEQKPAAERPPATIAMPDLYERLAPAVVQIVTYATGQSTAPAALAEPGAP